jgi:hypothetical protein
MDSKSGFQPTRNDKVRNRCRTKIKTPVQGAAIRDCFLMPATGQAHGLFAPITGQARDLFSVDHRAGP